MPFYAHTKTHPDGTPAPQAEWEPLFNCVPCSYVYSENRRKEK